MNCERFDNLLEASLTDPLGPVDQAEFDAHLSACPACVVTLQHYVITTQALQALGALESVEETPALPERLVQKILAGRAAATQVRRGTKTA